MGGWLSLLIVILIVIGPLLGFGNIYGTFSDAEKQVPELASNTRWTAYVQVTWLLFSGFMAMGIAAGYRLWKIHKKDSVTFAIVTLWVIGPGANIAHAVTGAVALNKPLTTENIAASFGEFAASCIIATLWTLYLRRSSRVKNTYR